MNLTDNDNKDIAGYECLHQLYNRWSKNLRLYGEIEDSSKYVFITFFNYARICLIIALIKEFILKVDRNLYKKDISPEKMLIDGRFKGWM